MGRDLLLFAAGYALVAVAFYQTPVGMLLAALYGAGAFACVSVWVQYREN
ncbi:hypothetical protein HUG10_21370 (plasmid) [Halorarum halophilum]|uniref:Uncharacterized protein n=1 Tax=Halorarum halophilum TaxID=2743090 RepID=A0A7D5KWB7_9EURY|nr:hypothetical protein [Halobaculum halophilum]QLG30140.1 hypothetical protein HUG10_21370 [Halobaculum halophilum]